MAPQSVDVMLLLLHPAAKVDKNMSSRTTTLVLQQEEQSIGISLRGTPTTASSSAGRRERQSDDDRNNEDNFSSVKSLVLASSSSSPPQGAAATMMAVIENAAATGFDAGVKADTDLVLLDMQKDSKLFREQTPRNLPRFESNELLLSRVIGQGEFGEVCNVLAFRDRDGHFRSVGSSNQDLDTSVRTKNKLKELLRLGSRADVEDSLFRDVKPEDLRAFMAERCHRGDIPRYAVKRILSLHRPGTEMNSSAIIDLAAEAKFLSHLEHSNIIKVRATVGTPGTAGFMMVIDRLVSVLDNKVKEWKQEDRSYKPRGHHFTKFMFGGRDNMERHDLATDRFVAMFDIARALRYLRNHRVLFRDLKPENIGCDVRGDFKIFDFGLAKELKEKDLAAKPDGYNNTGMVGTVRWMAPEVYLCKKYGFSSDVFSFCMLFWHVTTLNLPFDRYDSKTYKKRVIFGGERPSGKKLKASKMLREAIISGWGEDCDGRPTIAKLCELIQLEILLRKNENKKRGNEGSLVDRSRHLLDQSIDSRFGDE